MVAQALHYEALSALGGFYLWCQKVLEAAVQSVLSSFLFYL